MGDLSLESLSGFIQAQVVRRDNGIIFICLKMRQGSRFACRVMKTKNPAEARFFLQRLRLVTAVHTVLRQRTKYTRSHGNAQFTARILTHLSMAPASRFVHKLLFIYTVFIYTGCVHRVRGEPLVVHRRNEVLAETGGAVSASTPQLSTLCYVNKGAGHRRRKGTPASCSLTRGDAYERSGYGCTYPQTHCCSTATA